MATTNPQEDQVPQPAAAPKADSKAAEKAAAEQAAAAAWAELVARATDGDSPAARQIGRAVKLEKERADLMKRISDNRDYLRLMDRNEELDDDQAEFLDTFYPVKEKGDHRSASDIEATRKAREAARKDSNGQ